MKTDFEKILANAFIRDEGTLVTLLTSFQPKHFDDPGVGKIFDIVRRHYTKYTELPDFPVLESSLDADEKKILSEVRSLDIDLGKSSKWIEDEADKFIKRKSLELALIDCGPLLKKGKFGEIEKRMTEALTAGTKVDIGLRYFSDVKERIVALWKNKGRRIETGFENLDRVTNGGFYTPSLIVLLGRVNLGKSLFLSNFALRQSELGRNVVIITLELASDLISQRIDAHLTGYNINELPGSASQDIDKAKEIIKLCRKKRERENYGEIYIKEYPPATINSSHIRKYLKELELRKIKFDLILIDYLNLMRSWLGGNDSLYEKGKSVSEELRAVSFLYKVPVITVSQLNREGIFADWDDLNMGHTGESMGILHTADFSAVIGRSEDDMVYESEIFWKVLKSRMGPVGDTWKTYMNPYSLKFYDNQEKFLRSFEISDGAPRFFGEKNE